MTFLNINCKTFEAIFRSALIREIGIALLGNPIQVFHQSVHYAKDTSKDDVSVSSRKLKSDM